MSGIFFDQNSMVSYVFIKSLNKCRNIELYEGEIILNTICCEIQFDAMSIKKKGTLYLTNYKMQFLIYNVSCITNISILFTHRLFIKYRKTFQSYINHFYFQIRRLHFVLRMNQATVDLYRLMITQLSTLLLK